MQISRKLLKNEIKLQDLFNECPYIFCSLALQDFLAGTHFIVHSRLCFPKNSIDDKCMAFERFMPHVAGKENIAI